MSIAGRCTRLTTDPKANNRNIARVADGTGSSGADLADHFYPELGSGSLPAPSRIMAARAREKHHCDEPSVTLASVHSRYRYAHMTILQLMWTDSQTTSPRAQNSRRIHPRIQHARDTSSSPKACARAARSPVRAASSHTALRARGGRMTMEQIASLAPSLPRPCGLIIMSSWERHPRSGRTRFPELWRKEFQATVAALQGTM